MRYNFNSQVSKDNYNRIEKFLSKIPELEKCSQKNYPRGWRYRGFTFWFVFNNTETVENFDELQNDFFIVFLQNSDVVYDEKRNPETLQIIKQKGKEEEVKEENQTNFELSYWKIYRGSPNKNLNINNLLFFDTDNKKVDIESKDWFTDKDRSEKDWNSIKKEKCKEKGWLSLEEARQVIKEIIGMSEHDNVNVKTVVKEKIKKNKQVIFTGAPGTGKTYTVREVVEELCEKKEERFKFVQFHSSYDYTDFVEGLRPAKVAGAENTTFVRMDGIFKAFCRKIVEAGLEKVRNNNSSAYENLSDEELLEKIYNSEKKELIGGVGNNELDIFDGKKEEEQYYFIVDEINRADLGKVFGELMFGLEESYRGIKHRFDTQYMNLPTYIVKDGVAEKLSFDCFKNGFFIPKNLHFIGTMNDIDRSVESFDFALRRRFQWIEIKANDIMEESLKSMYIKEENIQGDISKKEEENIKELSNRIINMNKLLNPEKGDTFGLSEAYHIGPAYFKSIFTDENLRKQIKEEEFSWSTEGKEKLEEIFKHKIASIIREYLRGRDLSKIEGLVNGCKTALTTQGTSMNSPNGNKLIQK